MEKHTLSLQEQHDTVALLQQYLRINTAHPQPDYAAVVDFFVAHAKCDGFACRVLTLPSGYSALVITHQGHDVTLPALVLNHHMDVVPIETAAAWEAEPFAGTLLDERIIGRGTQDMKGVGIAHYAALRHVVQQHGQLQRTVHCFVVPHEEVGGAEGTAQLLEHSYVQNLNIGMVLDEGIPSGDAQKLYLKVTERKPLQICVTATGTSGHGSQLHAHNAAHDLITFLQRMTHLHNEQQKKQGPAGLALSCNITTLAAGEQSVCNIIPQQAQATIDIRVPPTMSFDQVHAILQKNMSDIPSLQYTVIASADDVPSVVDVKKQQQTPLYTAVADVVQRAGCTPQTLYAEFASDLRFYTARGIDGIGFTPFTSPNRLHAVNEYVTTHELIQAAELFSDIIYILCSASLGDTD